MDGLDEFGGRLAPFPVGVAGFGEDGAHAVVGPSVIDRAQVQPAHHDLQGPLVTRVEAIGVDVGSSKVGGVDKVAGRACGDVGAHEVDLGLEVVVERHFPGHNHLALLQQAQQVFDIRHLPQLCPDGVHLRSDGGGRAHRWQGHLVLDAGAGEYTEHLISKSGRQHNQTIPSITHPYHTPVSSVGRQPFEAYWVQRSSLTTTRAQDNSVGVCYIFTMPQKKTEPAKQPPKPIQAKAKDRAEASKLPSLKEQLGKGNKASLQKDNKNGKSIQKLEKEAVKGNDKNDKKGGKQVPKPVEIKSGKPGDKNNTKDVRDAKKDPKSLEKDKKGVQSSQSIQKLDLRSKKGGTKELRQQKKEEQGKKGEVKEDKRGRGKSPEKEKDKDPKDKGGKEKEKDKDKKGEGKIPRANEKSPKGNGKNAKEENVVVKPKLEEDVIKQSGLLQAYQLFLRAVCKHGLPDGNVYEFAAQQIERYQRKKRGQELKAKAELQIEKVARRREERERMQSIGND